MGSLALSPDGRTISVSFAETFFRYLAFQKPDPNYDLKSFNFESDPGRLRTIGSKIVMYFGWADPALNPLMGVDYYEKVSARFGPSITDFFRLFMVPGMAHCRGGVGTDEFDAFTALVEWVEKGVTPKQIIASQSRGGKMIRTRPLCPYPQVTKYNGAGNPDDAKSFVCANP